MNTGPARRHPTSLALVAWATLVPALSFVVGSVLAYQLDVEALHSPMEAVNQWLTGRAIVDMALIVSPAIALVLAVGPLIRFELRDGGSGREAVLGMRLRLANVLVAVTALAIGAVLALARRLRVDAGSRSLALLSRRDDAVFDLPGVIEGVPRRAADRVTCRPPRATARPAVG